jgi:hypothetical protein
VNTVPLIKLIAALVALVSGAAACVLVVLLARAVVG